MSRRIVADAGPLIALARIGRLDLLHDIFDAIHIPVAVRNELQLDSSLPGAEQLREAVRQEWIKVTPVSSAPIRLTLSVGAGEAEAIFLAAEQHALLLIDESRGRTAAKERGIVLVGTGRVLLEAKNRGLLLLVSPILNALIRSGYRLAPRLRRKILELAHEEA